MTDPLADRLDAAVQTAEVRDRLTGPRTVSHELILAMDGPTQQRVLLDGEDISGMVRAVAVHCEAGELPRVTLQVVPGKASAMRVRLPEARCVLDVDAYDLERALAEAFVAVGLNISALATRRASDHLMGALAKGER